MYYAQVIFYVLLIVAIAATFRDPFWGAVSYYYLSFFRPQDYYHWAFTSERFSYWIALVTIFSYFVQRGKFGYTIPKTKETFLMLSFLIAVSISTYFSPMQENSWPIFLIFSKIVLFYFFALAMVDSEKKLKIMLWVLIYSFVYYAIWVNKRFIFEGIKMIEGPGALEGATYRDRNTFSLIFVTAIPICFYMRYLVRNKLLKLSLLAAIPVLMHAVICTFSRGGYLGMLAASGYCLLKIKRKAVMVSLILIFIPMLLLMQGKEHRNRINTIAVEGEARDSSSQSRIEAWKGGLKMMADRPLVGVGLKNFEVFVSKYNPKVPGIVAHNTFIQIGGEAGIPAMVLYILILLVSFSTLFGLGHKATENKVSLDLYYYTVMLEGSLVGFVFCSLFLSMQVFEPVYFLFAMVVCLKKLAEKGTFNLKREDNGRSGISLS